MAYDYEIVVIGGGPGGYYAAIEAAQAGKKTCLIERDKLGGTCLNVGCIPTKVLIKSAALLHDIRKAADFGIEELDTTRATISMEALQKRKRAVVDQLVHGVKGLLLGNGVELLEGEAAFQDAHTVRVGETRQISSEYFILATGAESVIPDTIHQEAGSCILTSTQALMLDHVPESVAILGGGVIGVEFAYLLNQMDCHVTVIERMNEILPMVDGEIARMARRRMEKDGIIFCLGAKVTHIKAGCVRFECDGVERSVKAEQVLMAVGRKPNLKGLNGEKIGLEVDHGAIRCDSTLVTNLPHIYAVGDVNGRSLLAHTAFHEASVAVKNICGGHETVRYDHVPSCIYTVPEIACIGLTEEQAKEQYGDRIQVGRFSASANGKSLVEGETEGLFKVIVDREYGEILGVHLYGLHVTEMIAQFALAMEAEATAEEVIRSIQPHPTVSEALGEAFRSAWIGKTIHSM